MHKRRHATSWKLVLGTLVAAASCGDDKDTKSGLTGTAGATPGAGGISAAPAGESGTGVGVGTAGTGTPIAGRAGMVGVPAAGSAVIGGTSGAVAAAGSTGGVVAVVAGSGGMPATGGSGASTAGMPAGADGTPAPPGGSGCTPAPMAKFETMTARGGPGGDYTIFRPTTLGEGGFKHPPVAWGNGLATTPDQYAAWLNNVASHGFVVIANPGTGSDPQVVRQGLEWLIAEGSGSGDYAGKLAENCAGTIGYSMGGGAAVGSGSHPAVRAVVSVHGLPDASGSISGPLLLTTSDDDGFVTKSMFAQPCYDNSTKQPTILATYISGNAPSFNGHLTPLGDGKQDAEPTIAWLRYWLYGDQSQKEWFFGANCKLCVDPWAEVQKKNHTWD